MQSRVSTLVDQIIVYLTIYFSKPQSCLYLRMYSIQIHSFKARRFKLRMRPLLIVGRVMCGMRPASAASEAIEAEVSLKVWDVLHPRVAVEGGGRAKRAKRAYRRRPRSSCRRRVRYTMTKRTKFKA